MSSESRSSGMNAGWLERHKQTCDPMVEAYWTFWQALAWAIHLDADKVRGTSKDWLMICPTEERREIWLEFSFEAGRARTALDGKLQSGTLTATGIDTATRKRRAISALEWLDLESVQCAKAEPQFYHRDKRFDRLTLPKPDFRDILIRRVDVLREFPAAEVSDAQSAPSVVAPSCRNVSDSDLNKFLKKTATRQHTKPKLRELAEQEFTGRRITDIRFNDAYKALPDEQKRSRGDTERTLRLDNSAKG
jgi:hypothetical protein